MQKIISRLFSALTKEKKIGLIGILAAVAVLFSQSAFAHPDPIPRPPDYYSGVRDSLTDKKDCADLYRVHYVDKNGARALTKSYYIACKQRLIALAKIEKEIGEQPEAQYWLGYFYEKGLGMEQNLVLAQTWYKRAADQGHAKALYRLQLSEL